MLELPDSLKITNPKPIDALYGPYSDLATAKAAVPQALRYQGLKVGVLENGSVTDYWWKDGIADGDLVEKYSAAIGTIQIVGSFDADNETDFPNGDVKKGFAYEITSDGEIHGVQLYDGDLLIASKDNPDKTLPDDWLIQAQSRALFVGKVFDDILTAYASVADLLAQNYDAAHGYLQGSEIVCNSASTYTRYEKFTDTDTDWMYFTNANGWQILPQS